MYGYLWTFGEFVHIINICLLAVPRVPPTDFVLKPDSTGRGLIATWKAPDPTKLNGRISYYKIIFRKVGSQVENKTEDIAVSKHTGNQPLNIYRHLSDTIRRNICYLPAGRSVYMFLSHALKVLPSACGLEQHFEDLGHSFSLYGPTLSRYITFFFLPKNCFNFCKHKDKISRKCYRGLLYLPQSAVHSVENDIGLA